MIMAVHPVVLATMKKLNLIETEHYADQNITIHRYLGYRIVQDDQMTTDIAASVTTGVDDKGDAITETNVTTYYSYLFGPGAIALGYGTPRIPFEVDRNPAAGKGGGQETVYSRVDWVIHPQGYSYSTTAGVTIAALETGTNWTRAWERKRIKFIAIRTLG
jgi:hypothetical protein